MTQPYPNRRSPRMQGYDYSQEGAYFVTICTRNREHVFGAVQNGEFSASTVGTIAFEDWQQITSHYSRVVLDSFVVMPNHVHGIIFLIGAAINSAVESQSVSKAVYLSQVIAGYKAGVTRRMNRLGSVAGRINPAPTTSHLWQRSFHDHIIRSEGELNRIRQYVANNPALWAQDRFYG